MFLLRPLFAEQSLHFPLELLFLEVLLHLLLLLPLYFLEDGCVDLLLVSLPHVVFHLTVETLSHLVLVEVYHVQSVLVIRYFLFDLEPDSFLKLMRQCFCQQTLLGNLAEFALTLLRV